MRQAAKSDDNGMITALRARKLGCGWTWQITQTELLRATGVKDTLLVPCQTLTSCTRKQTGGTRPVLLCSTRTNPGRTQTASNTSVRKHTVTEASRAGCPDSSSAAIVSTTLSTLQAGLLNTFVRTSAMLLSIGRACTTVRRSACVPTQYMAGNYSASWPRPREPCHIRKRTYHPQEEHMQQADVTIARRCRQSVSRSCDVHISRGTRTPHQRSHVPLVKAHRCTYVHLAHAGLMYGRQMRSAAAALCLLNGANAALQWSGRWRASKGPRHD